MTLQFPTFTSSDRELNITYGYRCELYGRHVKETPTGHVITEFLPKVSWSGPYNTINCAASHHFREGRWMWDTSPLRSYADFWCTEGNPRHYSLPLSHSVLMLARVTGDYGDALRLYPRLARIYGAWEDHRTENGMYRQECGCDGMEYSISGDGVRPTINSYMVADALALGEIAERLGDGEAACRYRRDADTLSRRINEELWNPEIGMYGVRSDNGALQNVREQIGYIPWMYGIPPTGRDGCFRYLLDPDCFLAPYGLRTAEVTHPDYGKYFHHECLWNGPVWPFATAQTLTAVAEYLHATPYPTVTPDDFTRLLLQYAYSHRDEDGTPYLDENMDPDTGIWLARSILRSWDPKSPDRGLHYNHSSFIDLIVTGLCGICPADGDELTVHPLGTALDSFSLEGVRYHGHTLGVEWDRREGLAVTVDGNRRVEAAPTPDVKITVTL